MFPRALNMPLHPVHESVYNNMFNLKILMMVNQYLIFLLDLLKVTANKCNTFLKRLLESYTTRPFERENFDLLFSFPRVLN